MERQMLTIKTPFTAGVASVLINFLAPQFACAEDYFDLSLEQLLETRVLSVSKKNESIANSPAAIYVVTSEDIARSGITTIPDALRMVPGVNVARADSNTWAISIRGFNSTLANKLLVLIDGRSVYNPVYGGVLWEAHNLMLADIERIEVIRGPGGALWGANAVNGVINIITKNAGNTQGEIVSATVGNEEADISVRHGGKFGDDGTYRVYAKALKHDSAQKLDGGDAYDKWDGARAGFRADWGEQFMLQGDIYRTEQTQFNPWFRLVPPFVSFEKNTISYEGANLLGRWTQQRADGAQLSVQTYIDWTKRVEPFNFTDNRTTYDVEAQYNLAPTDRHELVTGAGFRFLSDDEVGSENVSFSPMQRRSKLYSAFFQDKITLSEERWFLTVGSKFEHNEYSGTEIQPNLRLQWHPTEKQMWWTAVSKAVRTPTPTESDATATLSTGVVPGTTFPARIALVPNEDFKSERLVAYELGYRHQVNSSISFDISAFRNDYDDLQAKTFQPLEPVLSGPNAPYFLIPLKLTNLMYGSSHGIEMAMNFAVTENLKLGFNYSGLRMSLTAVDPTQESDEKNYPKNQMGLKIFWNINDAWTLDNTTTYVDKLPGLEIDSYTRVDINLGGKLTENVRVNLVGQNLLESTHMEFGSVTDINTAEIERSIFAKLTWIL